ncbi:MAG: hypothetical protein K6G71_07910 [Clostridiales bacterium]|nr:hypothetical protein [Clostridiales bacterium]
MVFDELKATREKPIDVIFGTDWWSDCDDVAALDIILKAHGSGLIDLKAIGVNSVMPYSAPSVKALCEQYGLGSISIGLDKSAERKGLLCMYQKTLASFCRSGITNSDCPDAYKLYRRVLASVPEKAVVADVGFPGIIAELLMSSPDAYCDLDGISLVRSKVSEIVIMGGRWDKKSGREYNFCAYKKNREAAAYICGNSPVPVTFLGYEVGMNVITGGKRVPGLVGTAYAAHLSPNGRPSWDPMTALYVITGDADSGYKKIRGTANVDPRSGKNSFTEDENGPHSYLSKLKDDRFYETRINEILNTDLQQRQFVIL